MLYFVQHTHTQQRHNTVTLLLQHIHNTALMCTFTARPEEIENERRQKRRKEKECRSLLISTKKDLMKQERNDKGKEKTILDRLKAHLLLLPEDRSGINYTQCKLKVRESQSTDELIDTMAAYNLFDYRDMSTLIDIAQRFCRQSVQDRASDVESLYCK